MEKKTLNKLISDVTCVFIKEFWQISNNKKLIISVIAIAFMPIVSAFNCENSILPMIYLRNVLPISVSFIAANTIMQTIIIDEINYKTLDILITSKLSKLSIIIGKASLGVAFGLSATFISLIILYVASFFSPYLEGYKFISLFNIIASFEVALIASLISIVLALILKNVQAMNAINMIIIIGIIFVIYYFTYKLLVPMYIIGMGIGVICILLISLSVKFISMKNYTIN